MRTKKVQPGYTTILHSVRKELGLSCNAYIVADLIWKLSSNPRGKVKGWCYASKDVMAEALGLGRKTIFSILNELESKGIVERDPESSYLRTTARWYDAVYEGKVDIKRMRETRGVETALCVSRAEWTRPVDDRYADGADEALPPWKKSA